MKYFAIFRRFRLHVRCKCTIYVFDESAEGTSENVAVVYKRIANDVFFKIAMGVGAFALLPTPVPTPMNFWSYGQSAYPINCLCPLPSLPSASYTTACKNIIYMYIVEDVVQTPKQLCTVNGTIG